ncbi:MAG: carboxypeptidase-like regulatory domain-containing protein [Bacteroidales bacterium]|nr:carboxypeptidase-like regulatory domain-containing protein [Bacteroidales bacterium]
MKKEIRFLQKFLAISRVLQSSEAIFDNKPGAPQAKAQFMEQTGLLAANINLLVRPGGSLLVNRRDQRADLKLRLAELAHLGILMAGRMQNEEIRHLFIHYHRKIPAVSSAMMLAIGMDMLEQFDQNATQVEELGLDANAMADLRTRLCHFSELTFDTQSRLDTRRANLAAIRQMIASCNRLLRDELDHFARFCRGSHPVWYASYMRLRRTPRGHKPPVALAETVLEGDVTDAQTGQPLSDATIRLVEQNLVTTTGADGKFKLNAVSGGAASLSCYHAGYRIATQYLQIDIEYPQPNRHFILEPG